MSSFNEISGVPSSASKWLMSDVLRTEWGFQGFVVSDWTAIEELIMHGVAADREEAGKLAIEAGVDCDMVSRIYMKELPALVRSGKVKESVVDESVRRVLRMKFKLGLFDDPYRGINAEREKRSILSEDHLQKARVSARKSIVLLKNENTLLPLSKQIKTVALIGPLADDAEDMLGGWHASGKAEDVVTILQGIKKALPPSSNVLYAKGCGIDDSTENFTDALEKVRQAEVAIVALGESERMSGEASSRATLDLPGVQMELLQKIVATGVPTVLILTNGRPLTIGWPAAHVPAIVETWFLGVQAGAAIADVLFGDENPSGRLPVTFPRSVGQIPLYYNHKNTGRPYSEKEHYTSKYLDMPNSPLFPFGYGLSYTSFAYSDLKVSSPVVGSTDSIRVTVRVANTGSRKGEEVVQLYLRDDVASVTRPVKELKRFARIALDSGAAQTISFVLYPDDLSMYNLEMKKVIEPGTFTVFVGKNSEDVMETKFEVK
jgi:beta-glucosidase